MIVDSSAVAAVVFREERCEEIAATLSNTPHAAMSGANLVEVAIVVERRLGPTALRRMDVLLEQVWGVRIEPVSVEHARIARAAYRDFGKGSGHPAQLNFGDCFAYALAVETDQPLLFVGDDFTHTDVRVALR